MFWKAVPLPELGGHTNTVLVTAPTLTEAWTRALTLFEQWGWRLFAVEPFLGAEQ